MVVGGGTAGARRRRAALRGPGRSASASWRPGPPTSATTTILRLDRWMALLESGYDWDYPVEPQENGNSFMRHARAKVLGGCSSHNSCIAFWAPAEDLDEWAARGAVRAGAPRTASRSTGGWRPTDAPGDHHGRTGPVTIRTVAADDPCGDGAAGGLRGRRASPPPRSTPARRWCAARTGSRSTPKPDGIRSSASVSYLHPVLGKRPNLDVRTGLQAKRLLLDTRTGAARASSTWSPTPPRDDGDARGARSSSPAGPSTRRSC